MGGSRLKRITRGRGFCLEFLLPQREQRYMSQAGRGRGEKLPPGLRVVDRNTLAGVSIHWPAP